ncbi:MAG: hypothetical protein HQL01_04240 [Nitrospirae bacterium]|nr:hypothetical protein [Nitrospirota bacterium]
MNSELYLDLVSKTIITMLSKEIAVDVGAQIGAQVNELLNNTLSGLLSEKIASQTERLGRGIMELEGTLRPQISGLSTQITEISGQISEGIKKSGLESEIEVVKGSIDKGLQSHKEMLGEVLSIKEGLSALTGTITGSIGNLSKQMTSIGDSTRALAEKVANPDALKQALDVLQKQADEAAKSYGAIKKDLSSINEELKKNLGKQIEGVASKINTSFTDMDKRISGIVDSTAKLAGETNLDIVKQVIDGLQRQAVEAAAASGAIKKDITAISEALQTNFDKQNKLIGDTLGQRVEGISSKIDTAFANMDKRISDIVDTTARLAGESNLDVLKQVVDGLQRQAEEAAKNSNAIKRDLSTIGEVIQSNFDEQGKLIGDTVGDRIEGIAAKIDKSFTDIGKIMSSLIDSTTKLAGETNLDIVKKVMDGLQRQAEEAAATSGVIKKDLSAINETLKKNLSGQVEGITGKIDTLFVDISNKISNISEDLLRQITTVVDNEANTSRIMKEAINGGLKDIIESIQRLGSEEERAKHIDTMAKKVGDSLKVIEKDIANATEASRVLITEKMNEIDASVNGVVESQARREKSIMTIFTEDMASIKQTLQMREKEEGEMVKGVYYSMKKLTNDFNKEKENTILFNKQYLTSMNDLKKHIEDDLGRRLKSAEELNTSLKNDIQKLNQTLQHSVKEQNKLLIDIIGTLEKQLPFFSGKFDEALSGIDTKITGFERTAKSQITNAGIDFMKFIDENVVNNLKDLEKTYGSLKGEISTIKQQTSGNVKEQADVLQGVFLSVKKLLNIATKERDDSEKVARDLNHALDSLYSQIRRLESDKDELGVELLRLAGDDYFKNKFKTLEDELVKSRNIAEKYQEENRELEQKYLMLQQQWNESHDVDGE